MRRSSYKRTCFLFGLGIYLYLSITQSNGILSRVRQVGFNANDDDEISSRQKEEETPMPHKHRTPPFELGRKKGTKIILNIGSNLDPIVPRPTDDPCTRSIAFEPIVGHRIPSHPGLHVVTAAVTAEPGWSSMHLYNKNGVSSSLSKPSYSAKWNQGVSTLKIVPTISFRTILESLRDFETDMIMTDMQGHDFVAVSSVGSLLKETNVKRLVTEVYTDNVVTYQDVSNDFCRDWLPHMTKIGYIFEGMFNALNSDKSFTEGFQNAKEAEATCQKAMASTSKNKTKPGLNEYNAYWRLESVPASDGDMSSFYHYGSHSESSPGHQFTDEEYKAC